MDLQAAAIVLRRRRPVEVWDLAFHWGGRSFIGLTLLAVLPVAVGLYLLHAIWQVDWVGVWCLAFLTTALLQAPFTTLASEQMFDPDANVRSVLKTRFTIGRTFRFFAAMFIAGLAHLAGLLILVGPFMTGPRLLFVPEAVLLEGSGVIESLKRANRIAASMRGRAFSFFCLRWLVTGFIVVLVEAGGHFIVDTSLQLGSPVGTLFEDGGSLYAVIGLHLSVPLVAAARFLEYIDARTRRDGWDLQIRLMKVAAEAGPSSAAEGRVA